MEDKSLTALMCLFVKSYHYKNNKYWIYYDNLSDKLMGSDYDVVYENLRKGREYFLPNSNLSDEDAVRKIVDNTLAPSILGRSAFCDFHLRNEIKLGIKNYLIFASGYDMSAYLNRFNNLNFYEFDQEKMIEDKIKRLDEALIEHDFVNYIPCDLSKDDLNKLNLKIEGKSFCSLLGISYYLTKEDFAKFLENISNLISVNSTICFDYPTDDDSEESLKNRKLADESGEKMLAKYNYKEIEKILSDNGFLIYEHVNYDEMTKQYFDKYNSLNPNNKIIAKKGTAYVLALKK